MTSMEITQVFKQGKIFNLHGINYYINTQDLSQYISDYKCTGYDGGFIDFLIKEWHMIVIVVPAVELVSTSKL